MAVIVDIAEAVKAELNAGQFSQAFTADRTYRPTRELVDLKDLRVTVVPRGIGMESASRSGGQDEYSVDVAIRKKVSAGAAGDAEADELMLLVEEIAAFFARRRLVGLEKAIWVRTENVPAFSSDHLEESSVFISLVTVTFRVIE